jgi:DNA-directed RNA polymerase specialized sigma24 family protein
MKELTYAQAAEVRDISMKSVYDTVSMALTAMRSYVRTLFENRERN